MGMADQYNKGGNWAWTSLVVNNKTVHNDYYWCFSVYK